MRDDLQAGMTVALVAVPQCMAFAAIAGLPPAAGLYSAVVMGLVGAALCSSSRLIMGPAVTTSTMVFAVLATVAPTQPAHWPAIAGVLAVLVGLFTVLAALLNVGQFVRFVSRSVLVGLTAGAAILILGSQLAPFLGIDAATEPTLAGILWDTRGRIGQAQASAALLAGGTMLFVMLGGWIAPRFPASFLVIVLSGVVVWGLERCGLASGLQAAGDIPHYIPRGLTPWYSGPYGTDVFVGAAAICLVGIIQTLAISKALASRSHETVEPKRELLALGMANLAAGPLHGFPGAASFARSALNDRAGAQTRLSGVFAAVTIVLVVLLAAPLARYITRPAIAGLLIATACSIVDWKEFAHLLTHGGDDRIVLVTTLLGVFILPIHWAILIGLAVSVAVFLRRVSQLHLFEMVSGANHQFQERPIDDDTGRSVITMLQVEGPLFFAHAEEILDTLKRVFQNRPRATILRMRRTQQIDFSVITALGRAVQEYVAGGGTIIICGLTPEMHAALRDSALGHLIHPEHLLQTTREVFGSAHKAIRLAEGMVPTDAEPDRPRFRTI